MARTFVECGNDERDLLERALRNWHGHLLDLGISINLLFVRAADKEGEALSGALKHQGYPALATVKINSLKDRAEGKSDATITIAEYEWQEQSEAQRLAILDHELTHLEPKTDEEGTVKRDDLGRPCLKIRLHDHQMGIFHTVAERHGPHSGEHASVLELGKAQWVQGMLSFHVG